LLLYIRNIATYRKVKIDISCGIDKWYKMNDILSHQFVFHNNINIWSVYNNIQIKLS